MRVKTSNRQSKGAIKVRFTEDGNLMWNNTDAFVCGWWRKAIFGRQLPLAGKPVWITLRKVPKLKYRACRVFRGEHY
jgi:hypothetical protein